MLNIWNSILMNIGNNDRKDILRLMEIEVDLRIRPYVVSASNIEWSVNNRHTILANRERSLNGRIPNLDIEDVFSSIIIIKIKQLSA